MGGARWKGVSYLRSVRGYSGVVVDCHVICVEKVAFLHLRVKPEEKLRQGMPHD